ncbi:MAG: hypothetical protein U5K69_16930 [Balneolaceae bacterium]|nr:hypothetical protein [Balneolaceae bacterium]
MKRLPSYLSIFAIVFFSISCENQVGVDEDIKDSLEPVEEVTLIPSGDNTILNINKDSQAFFTVELQNVEMVEILENVETMQAWCIDWLKPIDSDNGSYEGVKLYSTFKVEKWKPINYLLNIIGVLKGNDPAITYREIQIAIWSLRANPEFNLETVDIEDLPGRFREGGEPKFSYEKVEKILEIVENNYRRYEYPQGSKYALIIETPEEYPNRFFRN